MTDAAMTTRPAISPEKIWAVIPVYNNGATILDVARRTCAQIRQVLVIDDGSTDADLRQVLSNLPVQVIRHPVNRGKGAALLTALDYISAQGGEYMITLDGDGQHYPEDLPALVERLDPEAILIGQRAVVHGQMPRSSRFGREFSDFWVFVETGIQASDTQSGFRAYPVRLIRRLGFCSRHYNFEVEVVTRALWAGMRTVKVPIRVWYPPKEERVSSFRPFMDNLRLSLLHSRLVGRRLLPVPHQRLVQREKSGWKWRSPLVVMREELRNNSTPLGLAAAAGTGIFLGTLPIVFGHVAVIFYVSARLHLNKVMALGIQNLCAPPLVPMFCIAVGYRLRHGHLIDAGKPMDLIMHPLDRFYEWLLGSLVVAPIFAVLMGAFVYVIASLIRKRKTTGVEASPVSPAASAPESTS